MRLRGVAISATAGLLAAALAGCSALGFGSDPEPTTPSQPPSGDSWLVVQEGEAVPSASPTVGRRRATPVATLPLNSAGPSCPHDFSAQGAVMIPLSVTVGVRSLTATWPRQRESNYTIAAVPQKLVGGVQPPVRWQPVAAATSGCTVTATVSGLLSGQAYIVWLDAPNPGFDRDGTRYRYSGRSGVVYPK
jgi:hypothetical protein